MTFGDKLRRLGVLRNADRPHLAAEQSDARAPVTRAFDEQDFIAQLSGCQAVRTEHGTIYRKQTVYPLDYERGNVSLRTAFHIDNRSWRYLLPRDTTHDGFAITDAVFVDTETTGLGRGTGTYAFLVGIGRYTADAFVVQQYIMPDYGLEAPMMHAVTAALQAAAAIFTFNGKSFDGPLLQTRAVMNGLRLPLPPHIDLLHLSRRFFGNKAANCSLNQLEVDVLNVVRQNDVPGYMIPALYFDFLDRGEASVLAPVCHHNALDIVSSAALAGYIGAAVQSPLCAKPTGRALDGADLYAVAHMYWEQGQEEEALRCFEQARHRPYASGSSRGLYEALTTLYKRHGRYDDAVALWRAMVDDGLHLTLAFVELAKYYEHREGDFSVALTYTERCLEYVKRYEPVTVTRNALPTQQQPSLRDALHHRRQRLQRRLHTD